MRNFYDVLEVPKNASGAEIKKAFHKLSRQYHPDVNKDENAVEKFKEVSEAYETLSDPSKKSYYDQFGVAGGNSSNQHKPFNSVHGDFFNQVFGQGRQFVQQGPSIQVNVPITIAQAISGCEIDVKFNRHSLCTKCSGHGGTQTNCSHCDGTGFKVIHGRGMMAQTTCHACRGAGKILSNKCSSCTDGLVDPIEQSLKVQVPPGVETGMKFMQQGAGEPIVDGVPGDLFMIFSVEEHPILKKMNNGDVLLECPFSYSELVKGCKIDVPTLEGSVTVKIPPGTQPGVNFKLRGLGFPLFNNNLPTYHRGDQLVLVKLIVPQNVDNNYLEVVEKLQELDKDNVLSYRKDIIGALGGKDGKSEE